MPSTSLLWQSFRLVSPLWYFSAVSSSFKVSQHKKFSGYWRACLEQYMRRLLLCCHPLLINILLSLQWVHFLAGMPGKIIWKASAGKARLAKAPMKLALFMHIVKPGSMGWMQVETHALYKWPNLGYIMKHHVSTSSFMQPIHFCLGGNQQTNKIVLHVFPMMLLLVLLLKVWLMLGMIWLIWKWKNLSVEAESQQTSIRKNTICLWLYWQITHSGTGLVPSERQCHGDYVQPVEQAHTKDTPCSPVSDGLD